MLALSIDAANATGGLVSPAVGGAVLAAGYDRDFAALPPDGDAVEPARVPTLESLVPARLGPPAHRARAARSERGRQGKDSRRCTRPWRGTAGSRPAATLRPHVPVVVGLPGGEVVTVVRGGLATSSVSRRAWLRGGEPQHHLIDPRTGSPARTPWSDVTVAAGSCLRADVAAKAAFILGVAGPAWLDARGLPGRFLDRDGSVRLNAAWRRGLAEAALAA